MARPKSEDRRAALLDAAIQVFAEVGLGASTSMISARAKVAEGSLFTYFKTKNELVNAIYRDLRLQVADAVMTGYPRRASVRKRLEHVWVHYVGWGAAHPAARKTLKLVGMSPVVDETTRAQFGQLFGEVAQLEKDASPDVPAGMASSALKAFVEMTNELIDRQPKRKDELIRGGFQMLWGALTSKA